MILKHITRCLLVSSALCGWTVAPAQTTDEQQKEDVFELSPFVVNTEGDVGYLAGNTLSGSRMNTRLKDTAASISVFTPEFLSDIGATSTEEILSYGTNATVDMNQGSSSPNLAFMDAGLFTDARPNIRGIQATRTLDFFETDIPVDGYNLGRLDLNSGPNSILFGFASAGGVFNGATKEAKLTHEVASFSTQVGSWDYLRLTGDVNVVVAEDLAAIRLMGVHRDEEGWRTWDFKESDRFTGSLVLTPTKKTTIRVTYEDGNLEESAQKPFNLYDGVSAFIDIHGAGPYPIVDNLTNNRLGQYGYPRGEGLEPSQARAAILVSGAGIIDPYLFTQHHDGRTIFSNNDNTFNNSAALGVLTSSRYFGVPNSFGQNPDGAGNYGVDYYRREGWPFFAYGNSVFDLTLLPTEDQGNGMPYMPKKYGPGGPHQRREADFSRFVGRIEQRIGDHTTIELAYNQEEAEGWAELPGGGSEFLRLDVTQYLPGSHPDNVIPNPNYGRYFWEGGWWGQSEKTSREVARAIIAHEMDLGKFGNHRLAAFYEFSDYETDNWNGPMVYFDEDGMPIAKNATTWGGAHHGHNQVTVRNYFDNDDFKTWYFGYPQNPLPLHDNGKQYFFKYVPAATGGGGLRRVEQETHSYMIADQASFLSDTLILTVGLRRDEMEKKTFGFSRFKLLQPDDPMVLSGEKIAYEGVLDGTYDLDEPSADTYTAGAVYHLSEKVSLFYNVATNRGPQAPQIVVIPNEGSDKTSGPLTEGNGMDVGFMLDLWEGKVFGRFGYFETSNEKEGSVRNPAVGDLSRDITDTLALGLTDVDGEVLVAPVTNAGDWASNQTHVLSDTESSGYEVEIKANLTPGWSTTISYSYTDLARSNIFPNFDWWYADFVAKVSADGRAAYFDEWLVVDTGNTEGEQQLTIASAIENMQRAANSTRTSNEFGFNNRPHKFNFFTKYEFRDGPLEGLFVGGGWRWQSKNKVQRDLVGYDEDTNTDILGGTLRGPAVDEWDFLLGYTFKLGKGLLSHNSTLSIQLNVYNVFDNDDLNVIRFNRAQDGGFWKVAYNKPREFRLTARLTF